MGLDRFFSTDDEYVAQRGGIALEMVKAGYGEQTCLGHDATPYGCWGGRQPANPDCWLRVPEHELPWLLANGATDDNIDALLARSIRATFDAAAAMAG